MRILMISDVYFPRVNGVSTSIATFRDDLAQLGHEVRLLVPDYPVAPARPDDPAITRVASRFVPRDPEDRMMKRGRLDAVLRTLRPGDVDVVHIQTPFVAHYAGVACARRLGVPVVESYHTYFEHYLQHYVPFVPAPWMRGLARHFTVAQCAAVDAILSPSRQMAQALRDYGVRTPIEVLPTGLPASRFRPGDRQRFRQRHGIEPDRPLALFVGRVAHEKNIDFLIELWPRVLAGLPQALLLIAGEGPAAAHCRELVARLGLENSVRFVGYLERDTELLDCYRAADAFVFASKTETQGLVLLEAMAQGTPVVSTAVMGTVDVLEGATGAVVLRDPDDTQGFATAVLSVLASKERRAELCERAARDAARWSSRALAERLVGVYGRLVDGAAGARALPQPVATP